MARPKPSAPSTAPGWMRTRSPRRTRVTSVTRASSSQPSPTTQSSPITQPAPMTTPSPITRARADADEGADAGRGRDPCAVIGNDGAGMDAWQDVAGLARTRRRFSRTRRTDRGRSGTATGTGRRVFRAQTTTALAPCPRKVLPVGGVGQEGELAGAGTLERADAGDARVAVALQFQAEALGQVRQQRESGRSCRASPGDYCWLPKVNCRRSISSPVLTPALVVSPS